MTENMKSKILTVFCAGILALSGECSLQKHKLLLGSMIRI